MLSVHSTKTQQVCCWKGKGRESVSQPGKWIFRRAVFSYRLLYIFAWCIFLESFSYKYMIIPSIISVQIYNQLHPTISILSQFSPFSPVLFSCHDGRRLRNIFLGLLPYIKQPSQFGRWVTRPAVPGCKVSGGSGEPAWLSFHFSFFKPEWR